MAAAGNGLARARVCNWHQKSRCLGTVRITLRRRVPVLQDYLWESHYEACECHLSAIRSVAASLPRLLGVGGRRRLQFDSDYSVEDEASPLFFPPGTVLSLPSSSCRARILLTKHSAVHPRLMAILDRYRCSAPLLCRFGSLFRSSTSLAALYQPLINRHLLRNAFSPNFVI